MTVSKIVLCKGELSLTSLVVVLVLLFLVQFAWIGHLHVPFLFQAEVICKGELSLTSPVVVLVLLVLVQF